ncbi:PhoH family protein [Paenibacillus naphthalenovorans]|uniref:PhoH-like protein n=1 Tax=Paenibacillus naphthalenovorans TaxID=162209 RepID=A0A0U2W170_9BACL|nr:PhoH family protein [Paenibacillus naphthalenovorans]ALS22292.1 PhoH-like protein [Paenibacillus naphthalenovorans]
MKKVYVYDTNALLSDLHLLDLDGEKIIPEIVLHELDRLKMGSNETAYRARQAVRKLKSLANISYDHKFNKFHPSIITGNNDDCIVECAKEHNAILITGDFLIQLKAQAQDIEVFETENNEVIDSDYKGIKEIFIDTRLESDNETLAKIYENEDNFLNLYINQYLIVWDKSKPTYDEVGNLKGYEVIDKFKFNGEKLQKLKFKKIENMFLGTIKPLNIKQELMFDLLQDKNTTVKAGFGSFGVGKDFLMISHAIDMLMHQKIDKIVWVRNNVEVKDSNPIGFLPSDMESKLMPFAMPLADHLGGLDGLSSFLDKGKIEIQHLGFMRGRDIKRSLVYVSECENNTKEHIQLLLGRIGSDSMIWLNGDTRQIDHDKFKVNNGVNALKMLKGQKLYGQVTLDKTERSETAKLADLLD